MKRCPSSLGSVLIIDDEAAIRESLETLLEMEGYAVESADSGEDGIGANLASTSFDLVLLDLALPDRNGMELLAEIHAQDPQLSVIMITAYGTVENAVKAMQVGAANFIQKPWDNEKLLADVRAAIARHRAEEENIQLKRALKQRYNFENIVGKSEPMLKIFDLVAQVAASRSTVLLQGESGTGKELIAKAIHLNSPRREQSFVPVNTGSMPPDLLESTLFGHVKGAFTSAIASKKGLFEVADRGTLVSRRNRHHEHGHAEQDSARASRPEIHAPGRSPGDSGGRAHHRRHQRRSASSRCGRQVPRRSVLPLERDHHRSAAVATAKRRHSAAGRASSSRNSPRRTIVPQRIYHRNSCACSWPIPGRATFVNWKM